MCIAWKFEDLRNPNDFKVLRPVLGETSEKNFDILLIPLLVNIKNSVRTETAKHVETSGSPGLSRSDS